jgi:hypothetical protein
VLQVIQHPLPVGELSSVQDAADGNLLEPKGRPHGPQGRPLTQPASAGAVNLCAEALETEGVIAICPNPSAKPEPGFSLVAGGAAGFEPPRLTFLA